MNVPDMAKTYDEQAAHFATFAPDSFTFAHIERPAWDRYLTDELKPDTKVLDIGSGSGRMARYFVSKGVKPQNITGVEISGNLVEIAKQQVPGVNFVCGDARGQIGIADGSLDLVTSHMVLEFLDPKGLREVLASVARLLSHGRLAPAAGSGSLESSRIRSDSQARSGSIHHQGLAVSHNHRVS